MPADESERKLIHQLVDAHAMERNVEHVLQSMISVQTDERIQQIMRLHVAETRHHIALLEGRLEAYGHHPSARKDAQALCGAFARNLGNMVRGDRQVKNVRDLYVIEHVEIATYQLLECLATRADDPENARVICLIRDQEVTMAERLDQAWGTVVDEALEDPRPSQRVGP